MNQRPAIWPAILLLQIAICLLFASILVTNVRVTDAFSATKPNAAIRGDDGKDAIVDYAAIETMIENKVQQKVAALPKPADGKDGKDGNNGYTPVKGVDYVDGKDGAPAKEQQPSLAALLLKVEQRLNPANSKPEWRCLGEELWTSMKDTPLLGDSCL